MNASECIAAEARARRHLQASPVRTSRRLTSSPGDTAQPGTKSCARADADGRHRCTGAFEPALSAPMIQHPTSLSCPVMRRVLSHLLGRRASFTVPSSTVPTIDNPGADGVNTVQRGCATCDPTPRFRPTRRMNHVPATHGQRASKSQYSGLIDRRDRDLHTCEGH